jgi:Flp pilus assembly protein TadD
MELASTLSGQDDHVQAISLLNKAIQLNPRNGGAFVNRGIEKVVIGDVDGAIADFNQGIAINPQDDNAYCCRGSALGGADRSGAIADFDRAIAMNPRSADAYYGRSVARYGGGELDAAIADCTKAIELQPGRANAHYTRGNCWSEKGDWDRAIADHDQAIALNPYDLSAHYNRGAAHLAKGSVEAALSDFATAREIRVENGFTARDGTIFSCYLDADLSGSEGSIACIVRWLAGFSDGGWDYEFVGGLRDNEKVFLVVGDRDPQAETTPGLLASREGGWHDVGAARVLSLLKAPRAQEFEGRCADIFSNPSADGGALRYGFDVGRWVGECEIRAGAGTLRIAGGSHNLSDGRLFLVTHRALAQRVKQLNRSLANIAYEKGYFRELARSDPEIRAFFLQSD